MRGISPQDLLRSALNCRPPLTAEPRGRDLAGRFEDERARLDAADTQAKDWIEDPLPKIGRLRHAGIPVADGPAKLPARIDGLAPFHPDIRPVVPRGIRARNTVDLDIAWRSFELLAARKANAGCSRPIEDLPGCGSCPCSGSKHVAEGSGFHCGVGDSDRATTRRLPSEVGCSSCICRR